MQSAYRSLSPSLSPHALCLSQISNNLSINKSFKKGNSFTRETGIWKQVALLSLAPSHQPWFLSPSLLSLCFLLSLLSTYSLYPTCSQPASTQSHTCDIAWSLTNLHGQLHSPFLWLSTIFPCSVPSSRPSAGTSTLRLTDGGLPVWEGLEQDGDGQQAGDGSCAEAGLDGGPQNFTPAFSGNAQVNLSPGLWQGAQ